MKYVTLVLVIVLSACSGKDYRVRTEYDCSKSKEEMSKFIIDCAKAANPLSDEEGEDLVAQCERTSRNIYCTEQEIVVLYSNGNCYTEAMEVTGCY